MEERKLKRIENFSKVEKLVEKKGVSFYQMSKELNISPTVFSEWKSGRSMPKTDKMLLIAEYLNVTVDFLIK